MEVLVARCGMCASVKRLNGGAVMVVPDFPTMKSAAVQVLKLWFGMFCHMSKRRAWISVFGMFIT